MPIRTFVPFNIDEDIVVANQTTVTTGLWSGDTGSLTSFFSSSTQISSSGEYYFDIYDKSPSTDSTAEVQFAVAYGHSNGDGTPTLAQDDLANLSTKATTLQYKNILLIGADAYSKNTDWSNRNCVFFGDGAGAVIISKIEGAWVDTDLYGDGTGTETAPGDSFTCYHGENFNMNASAVYEFANKVLPDSIKKSPEAF